MVSVAAQRPAKTFWLTPQHQLLEPFAVFRISRYIDRRLVVVIGCYATKYLLDNDPIRLHKSLKKINIFDAKIVLMPFNIGENHWILVVIINCGSIKETPEEGKPMPCLLYMDSMNYSNQEFINQQHFKLILGFLNKEWETKKNDKSEPFTRDSLPVFYPKGVSSGPGILTYSASFTHMVLLPSPSASTTKQLWLWGVCVSLRTRHG